jgi:23S rRNA pseudouridine1911/1915/1917 synthase
MNKRRPPQGKPGAPREYSVNENDTLLSFLVCRLPQESRRRLKKFLGSGRVLVDGQTVTQWDHPLEKGQRVRIEAAPSTAGDRRSPGLIVYEDDDLIVINKPAGLLAVGTGRGDERTAFRMTRDYIARRNPADGLFVVHRLDRDTSGIMLFARNASVKNRLQEAWTDYARERTYVAVVEGEVGTSEGSMVSYLRETKSLFMRAGPQAAGGKKAVTRYRVLRRSFPYTLVEVKLETGRKNQIRVHFQSIGHSVVGDRKYGASSNPLGRLGLHALALGLIHPVTGEGLRFYTPIPKSFLPLCPDMKGGGKLKGGGSVPYHD